MKRKSSSLDSSKENKETFLYKGVLKDPYKLMENELIGDIYA
jgi:hypothetical protein